MSIVIKKQLNFTKAVESDDEEEHQGQVSNEFVGPVDSISLHDHRRVNIKKEGFDVDARQSVVSIHLCLHYQKQRRLIISRAVDNRNINE